MTFAKGVTSGYQPLGGVILAPSVTGPLEEDPTFVLRHGHTYSGHPAACVAALAVIDILRREELAARAVAIGERLGAGLGALVDDGVLASVRGDRGMWAGVLADDRAVEVRDEMMRRGVIARFLGTSAIAFCPPLVIGDDDLDRCVEALHDAVTGLP